MRSSLKLNKTFTCTHCDHTHSEEDLKTIQKTSKTEVNVEKNICRATVKCINCGHRFPIIDLKIL